MLVSPCLEVDVLQCIRPLAAIDTPNGALPVTLRDSNLQRDTKDMTNSNTAHRKNLCIDTTIGILCAHGYNLIIANFK